MIYLKISHQIISLNYTNFHACQTLHSQFFNPHIIFQMSQIEDDSTNQIITNLFANENLTGFKIAQNTQIANIVKRDSTDFAVEVIKHLRGRQIICELIDVVLRPKLLVKHLQKQKQTPKISQTLSSFVEKCPKYFFDQSTPQTTSIIYNAIQILTNQYQEFVKFIFEDKPGPLIQSDEIVVHSQQKIIQGPEILKKTKSLGKNLNLATVSDEIFQDCVIIDGIYPELSKNEQDALIKQINSFVKLDQSQTFQCDILERMFKLFEEPEPIDQTPVSYFNKIILQFVYQKPEEIMRFFYCQDPFLHKKKQGNCLKIRKIAYHLYNHSLIQLLVHLMQLQNNGNFFPQQKIEILKAVTEEVFLYQEPAITKSSPFDEKTSTMSSIMEQRVNNYILFLKTLYEKLEDRYEQEKLLQIFKFHLNDQEILQKIISYFMHHFNCFDTSGLSTLLTQILKMDQTNFRLHKASNQASSPFGGSRDFSFNTKNEQSSIASYDLKLSKQILDQIEKVLTSLSVKFQQQERSTMRMIEYYELVHCWLNVTIKDRQNYVKDHLITPNFINQSLFKMQSHQRSSILHNSIKNILCDFLPKINEAMKILLAPECQLLLFVENYLEDYTENGLRPKKKCFQNQLYHITKTLLSIWEQQQMLNAIRKTDDGQQDYAKKMSSNEINHLITNEQNVIRFQKLKFIIGKKQQFYDHIICGDPRKMGEYHEQQSSEIIMASSFKNFFKPNFNNLRTQKDNNEAKASGKDRYVNEEIEEDHLKGYKKKKQGEDLNRQMNLKMEQRFKNLKLGDENTNLLFESAISPLNANRSHTFNFDFDALPLDSDKSQQAVSEEEDIPARDRSGGLNDDEMKLMQENIQNFDMIAGNILGVKSNVFSSNHSISNDPNLLSCDNYRREELSKSIDVPDLNMDTIQRVDSQLAIDSDRKHSQDDILSLGLDSNKGSGSKISDQNLGSKLDQVISQNLAFFMKEDSKNNEMRQLNQKQDKNEMQKIDSNLLNHYSSYLKYDINELCLEVE